MLVETGESWLNVAQAAKIAKVSRASIIAALRRGELKGFCTVCHGGMDLSLPQLPWKAHRCPKDPKRQKKVRVVLRGVDAARYSVLPWSQAAGRASARARAKKRRSMAAP